MAASQDAVWATDFDGGTVSRFDPATNEGTQVAELSGNPAAVAVFDDSVWVAQQRGGSVTRLEEPSGHVVAEVPVSDAGFVKGIAADAQGVWAGISDSGLVVRVDPSTNEVVAEIEVTTSPCGGIALQPDAVWVSSCYDDLSMVPGRQPPGAHRSGNGSHRSDRGVRTRRVRVVRGDGGLLCHLGRE